MVWGGLRWSDLRFNLPVWQCMWLPTPSISPQARSQGGFTPKGTSIICDYSGFMTPCKLIGMLKCCWIENCRCEQPCRCPSQDYTSNYLTNLDTGHSLRFSHKNPCTILYLEVKAGIKRNQFVSCMEAETSASAVLSMKALWELLLMTENDGKHFPPAPRSFLDAVQSLCKAILCLQASLNTLHTSPATSLSACTQHHVPNHAVIQRTCANFKLQIEQNFQHSTCISMLSAQYLHFNTFSTALAFKRNISSQSHINILWCFKETPSSSQQFPQPNSMRCANRNYIQLVFSSVQGSHFLLTNTIPIIFLMKYQQEVMYFSYLG